MKKLKKVMRKLAAAEHEVTRAKALDAVLAKALKKQGQTGTDQAIALHEAAVVELTKGGLSRPAALLKVAEDPKYRELFDRYRAASNADRLTKSGANMSVSSPTDGSGKKKKTKAEDEYEEEVEKLTKGGLSRAQAVLKIAEEPAYAQIFANYRASLKAA